MHKNLVWTKELIQINKKQVSKLYCVVIRELCLAFIQNVPVSIYLWRKDQVYWIVLFMNTLLKSFVFELMFSFSPFAYKTVVLK